MNICQSEDWHMKVHSIHFVNNKKLFWQKLGWIVEKSGGVRIGFAVN